LDKSYLISLVVVCALNGIPLAAKFLADAVLADIIDYDEFLTGGRNEATYTMFKSFLPKVMAIPAAALPLSVMNYCGHVPAVNGRIQFQPDMVRWSIRIMVSVLSGTAALLAWKLKKSYPLNSDAIVAAVADGIRKHKDGQAALDPVTGVEFSVTHFSDEENEAGVWNLDHWLGVELIEEIINDPDGALMSLKSKSSMSFILGLLFTISSAAGLYYSLPLLHSRKYSIIPTLVAVIMGASFVNLLFAHHRRRAAAALAASPPESEILQKVLKHRMSLRLLADANKAGKTLFGEAGPPAETTGSTPRASASAGGDANTGGAARAAGRAASSRASPRRAAAGDTASSANPAPAPAAAPSSPSSPTTPVPSLTPPTSTGAAAAAPAAPPKSPRSPSTATGATSASKGRRARPAPAAPAPKAADDDDEEF